MVYISAPYADGRKTKWNFLAHRLIRIWPAYIIVSALVLGATVLHGHGGASFEASPTRLLSFFFVPTFNKNGLLQPILGVGWTLNYEAFFYLAFALVLTIARFRIVAGLAAVLAVAFVAGLLSPAGSVMNAFFSNPILFEFLIGSAIGRLYLRGELDRFSPALLIAVGVVLLAGGALVPNESIWRVVVRGVPAAFIFTSMLLYGNTVKWSPVALFIGNASYGSVRNFVYGRA